MRANAVTVFYLVVKSFIHCIYFLRQQMFTLRRRNCEGTEHIEAKERFLCLTKIYVYFGFGHSCSKIF